MTFDEAKEVVERASHPEDLFGDPSRVTTLYRQLAVLIHPDKGGSEELFKKLTFLESQAKRKIASGTYGVKTLASIKLKHASYDLNEKYKSGSISEVYKATADNGNSVLVKVLRNVRNSDLFLNEKSTLNKLYKLKEHAGLLAHVPELIDSFEFTSGKSKTYGLVFSPLDGFYTLEEVRTKYKEGVDLRTAAWMFNRILGGIAAASLADIVHGSITPEHVLINPETHNGVLVGWAGSVSIGQKSKFTSSAWKSFYPAETTSKLPLTSATDIYMAAKCLLYILGLDEVTYKNNNKGVPKIITNYISYMLLHQKTRPSHAVETHIEFQEILKHLFGEPKFHPFTMDK